jgi:hypothetical protein
MAVNQMQRPNEKGQQDKPPYIKRILRVSMKKAQVTQNIAYKSYTNVVNGSLDGLYINRISNTSVLTRNTIIK